MERRKQKRVQFETFISHDILSDEIIHTDRMYNFSRDGLYFESNRRSSLGDDIYIGIGHAPHPSCDPIELVFGIEIIWRRELKNSAFRYGFGARFINSKNSLAKPMDIAGYLMKKAERSKSRKQAMSAIEVTRENDSRKQPRKSCRKLLAFTRKNRNYEGVVTDISRGGAFIRTGCRLSLGDAIDLVFDNMHGKDLRVMGWIVRLSAQGAGVSFDRRSGRERRYDLDRRTGQDRRRTSKGAAHRC